MSKRKNKETFRISILYSTQSPPVQNIIQRCLYKKATTQPLNPLKNHRSSYKTTRRQWIQELQALTRLHAPPLKVEPCRPTAWTNARRRRPSFRCSSLPKVLEIRLRDDAGVATRPHSRRVQPAETRRCEPEEEICHGSIPLARSNLICNLTCVGWIIYIILYELVHRCITCVMCWLLFLYVK